MNKVIRVVSKNYVTHFSFEVSQTSDIEIIFSIMQGKVHIYEFLWPYKDEWYFLQSEYCKGIFR